MQTSRLNVIKAFLNSILNLKMLTLLGIFIFSISALAMNGRTTYQAKIIKPDGYPLEASSVNFRFTVLDTVGSCVLYVEEYTAVNMSQSGGLISFALGNGARSFPASGTSQTFQNTFDNSVTSFSCQTPGIYNPGPNDTRKIVMQFHDGNGWQTLPAMTINTVPYAMYASKSNDSKTLNGKADTAFVENSTLAALNCNPATHAITFNGVSFSCISVGGGGGGITSVATSGTVLSTGGTASAPVISIQAATMSQDGYLTSLDYTEFKAKLSASSTQIVNTLGYAPVSGAAVATQINNSNLSGDVSGTISSNSVVSVAGKTASQISTSVDDTLAATSSATADTIVKRNSSGNATFNDVYANAAKINYVDIYKPSTSFNIRLQAPTSLSTNYVLNLPTTSGTTGQVLSTDGAGNLSWINSSTGSVVSVSATAPLASTGGSNPTISITQATSSTAGYLSSTDWNTFNNKQAATSAAIIATLGYTPATSTTLAASFVQKTGDTMTGLLTLKAGTTTNAPLKFTSGTLLSSAQSGTIEYDGSQLYFTDGANTRRAIATNSSQGSFDNTSSISNTSGNITLSPNNITGSVIVNSSQASISSGTGALVVNGGVGIAGSINAGGNLNLSGSATIGQSLQLSSMTSGSLLFAGASGLVSEDNSRLFWDGANKRLGLGTNSPVQTLSVSGASYFSGNVGIGTSSPASALDVSGFVTLSNLPTGPSGIHKSIDTGYIEMIGANASNLGAGIYLSGNNFSGVPTLAAGDAAISIASAASKIRFQVLGNDLMSITGQGNVGVGTSAPGARLEVSRNASASTAFDEVLRITQVNGTNGGAGPGLFFYGGTNNQAFGAIGGWNVSDGVGAQSAKLRFQTANAGTLVDRMVIDESGNVGVGTTTPTAKLQLAAGTSSTASFKLASGTLLTSPQSGTMEYDGAQFYLTDGTNTRRTIATGSSVGTIDNASTINSTGNITMVPVGSVVVSATTASTNSQTGSLVVKGGLGITGNLYSSGTIVTSSNIQGTSITATSGVSTTVIQGVPYLALNPNGGNVGIGTTSPDKTLVVNSTNTTNFAAEIYNSSSAAASNGLYVHSASTNPATMVAAIGSLSVMGDGNVGIGTTTPTFPLHISASSPATLMLQSNNFLGADGIVGQLMFQHGGNSTYRPRIAAFRESSDSNVGLLFSVAKPIGGGLSTTFDSMYINPYGHVGIGTTAPTQKLEVVGGKIQIDNNQGLYGRSTSGSLSRAIIAGNSSDNVEIGDSGGWDNVIFYPGSGEKMRITSSGNVGIGTAAPQTSLDVSGRTTLATAFAHVLSVTGKGTTYSDSADGIATFYSEVNVAAGGNVIKAGSAYAPNTFVVKDNGNIGVGTTSPQRTLNVVGSVGVQDSSLAHIHSFSDINGGANIDAYSGTSDSYFSVNTNLNGAGTSEKMRITGAGNVGIGTTSPSGILHLSSNATTGSQLIIQNTDTGGATVGIISTGSVNTGGAGLMRFDNPLGTERMVISSSGNVGIGTTNPQATLDVAGSIAQNGRTTEQSSAIALTADGTYQIASGSELDGIYELNWGGTGRHDYKKILVTSRQYDQANIIILASNNYSNQSVISNIRVTGDASGAIRYLLVDVANRNGNTTNLFVRAYGPTPSLALASSGYGTTAITNVASILSDRSGNVGIGTTSPVAKLHVDGSIMVGTTSASFTTSVGVPANNPGGHNAAMVPTNISFGSGGANMTYKAVRNGANTFNDEYITFATHEGGVSIGERMRITPSGNVGIGTTSPGSDVTMTGGGLTINGTGSTQLTVQNSGVSAFALNVGAANNVVGGWTMFDRVGGTWNQSISSNSGRIGIGTASPGSNLEVMASGGGGITIKANPSSPNDTGDFVFRNNDDSERARMHAGTGDSTSHSLWFDINGANRMMINSSGNVGIGTTSPSYKLDVSGTIRGYGITDSSDIRLKKDIQPLDFSLEKLLQVNGVTYYWKNPDMPKKQIGFIAQQLEKIYPELVETDQDGFKSVNYSHLIAPVIESIKMLYHRTVNTERRVASLEKTNNDKEKQIQAMQKALCEMGRKEFCHEK